MTKTEQPKNPFTRNVYEKWKNCNIGHTEDNKLIVWQNLFFSKHSGCKSGCEAVLKSSA